MKVVKYNTEEIYEIIVNWWKDRDFPVLPPNFVSNECFILEENDKKICGIFFYHTNSDLAWLAFPVSDPNIDKKTREGKLEKLLEGVTEYAKINDYKWLFTTSPLKHVQDNLLSSGFTEGDTNVNHYLKTL